MGLRIVFMGTPQFASYMLDRLHASSHEVVGVVTVADKPAGRGQKVRESDVKKIAQSIPLPIWQPLSLKEEGFVRELEALKADLFVVVAFRMLPEVIWRIPKRGTINLHASLLPEFRGAAPINWAIIAGESETGLSTFYINDRIDEGPILLQKSLEISEKTTAGTLHDSMLPLGASLLLETLDGIEKQSLKENPQ
ncbi:MAG: methionyl-tRNA formyltransferase, partial [Flavobacteriales bacterium]